MNQKFEIIPFRYKNYYSFYNDEYIEDIKLFQEDKLILMTTESLSVFFIPEKKIILKRKLKLNKQMKLEIYGNKIFVFNESVKMFEFIYKNTNEYILEDISKINKPELTKDILFYNNQIILSEEKDIKIYKLYKNDIQFIFKINYKRRFRVILHPNGKNIGIFELRKKNLYLYNLNNIYKLENKHHIKGIKFFSITSFNELKYLKYKGNEDKFILLNPSEGIYIYSSKNLQLINIFNSRDKIVDLIITKSGYIYGYKDWDIYKIDIKNQKEFLIPFEKEQSCQKLIFLENENIFIKQCQYAIYLYSYQFNMKLIEYFFIALFDIIATIFSNLNFYELIVVLLLSTSYLFIGLIKKIKYVFILYGIISLICSYFPKFIIIASVVIVFWLIYPYLLFLLLILYFLITGTRYKI